MKAVAIVLVLLTLLVQYRMWVDEQGVPALQRLDGAIETQRADNARLNERNARLAAEVRDLRTGLEAVEERARRELGMLREGEVFFHVDAELLDESSSLRRTAMDDARR